MSNPLNRYIVYGVAAAVAATDLQNSTICPSPGSTSPEHIEHGNDTAPIQQARPAATSTSSSSGGSPQSAPPIPAGLNYWDEEVDEPDDWWVGAESMSMRTPLSLMASLEEENA
jgi:hypothetical protein